MFPDKLDNAKVLYYTPKGDYGAMYYDTGEVAAYFEYLAICKYENARCRIATTSPEKSRLFSENAVTLRAACGVTWCL